MNRIAIPLAFSVAVALAFALWAEHSRSAALQIENNRRLATLEQQIESLRAELRQSVKIQQTAKTAAPNETSDLPQIRGAIAELRRRAEELEKRPAATGATNSAPVESYVYADSTRRKDYTFAGFRSPATAVESVLFAISKLDRKSFESTMTDEELKGWEKAFEDLPPDLMPGGFRNGSMYRATGFKIIEEIPVSETETKLKVFLEGQNQTLKLRFKKTDSEWKWAGHY